MNTRSMRPGTNAYGTLMLIELAGASLRERGLEAFPSNTRARLIPGWVQKLCRGARLAPVPGPWFLKRSETAGSARTGCQARPGIREEPVPPRPAPAAIGSEAERA